MSKTFNLPDSAYQFWKEFSLNGETFTLGHLTAFKHEFIRPERNETYTIYFTFSHHTFTRSYNKNEQVTGEQLYPFPQDDLRVFDGARYELSKSLPEILTTLPDQFCYHGGYSRYCSSKVMQPDGALITYQVVYRVWKKHGKMRFHIESAYPLREKQGKVKKVNFWTICYNLHKGKKLPQPAP